MAQPFRVEKRDNLHEHRRKICRPWSTARRPKTRKRRLRGWTGTGGSSGTSSTARGEARRDDTSILRTRRPGEKLASVAQGSAADIDAAVKAARAAFPKWQALSATCAGALFVCAGPASAETFAVLAVLETMDNGKPIRESRDIDIPLVARHFYHHAGWAQILPQEFPGVHRVRRGRTDHSLEFSAADAGVENCARPGDRQHGGAEAGGIHSADRTGICGNLSGDRTASGRGEHRDRRRIDGRGAGEASRRRQDCIHGIDGSGARHSECDRAESQAAVA